ncbi:MAG: ferritin-like domain-containing protein [Ilumatobacteraceae bacterium]
MNEPINVPTLTRRHILAGAAAIGAGLVAAACGSDTNDASGSTTGSSATTPPSSAAATTVVASADTTPATTAPTETSAPDASVDLKVAGLAAGLEALAVGTYKAALDAAGAGALGEVPPAVGEFVTVAMAQHQAQLDAWNKVLTGAGSAAVTEPNATLKPTVDAAFAKVTDVAGAATLALMLEQIASATYLNAQNVLTDKDAIQLAGSIQIIDAQHAAILLYVLGEYPVPDVFAKTEMAAAA